MDIKKLTNVQNLGEAGFTASSHLDGIMHGVVDGVEYVAVLDDFGGTVRAMLKKSEIKNMLK